MSRFAEKSFEVRFCAALSAAMMPFNRNPQWFGMTQAQERMTGIDTMVSTSGRLLLFQFKAQQEGKFKLEKEQWRNLDRVARKFPNSTHYVFPQAQTASEAAAPDCILRESWMCAPSTIGPAFRNNAASVSLKMDATNKNLEKSRPRTAVSIERTCSALGCFCPPAFRVRLKTSGEGDIDFIEFSTGPNPLFFGDEQTFRRLGFGIPMGDVQDVSTDTSPILSNQAFEELLEEFAERDLTPGLSGLFIPNTETDQTP